MRLRRDVCLGWPRPTPAALNAFYADLATSGRADGRGGLSARTVRYIHTILRKSLKDAERWSRVARNVADLADPPSAGAARAPEIRAWTADQLREFFAAIANDRLYAAFLLGATTGMRRGEIAGLRWSDVDLTAGRLSVRQARATVGYEVITSEPKTARGRRVVALDRSTVAALGEHRRRQLAERIALGPDYNTDDLVFCRPDGSPLDPEHFLKRLQRLARDHGLPKTTFHGLRHTSATLALAAGIHPKVVSERLGHGDVSLTLNTYSHAVPGLQEDAAERIADLIVG